MVIASRAASFGFEGLVSTRLDLGKALALLTLRERQMLWPSYAEGFSHRELAAALDLKEGSSRVLLLRAKRRLATILDSARNVGTGDQARVTTAVTAQKLCLGGCHER